MDNNLFIEKKFYRDMNNCFLFFNLSLAKKKKKCHVAGRGQGGGGVQREAKLRGKAERGDDTMQW